MKTRLSYSTLNALIHAPHTWICKQMGLKTFSIEAFEEGKRVHRIVQDHCSGKTLNEFLKDVPTFSIVEEEDWDPRTKIAFPVNEKYEMIGYVDMLDPEKKIFGEIKSSNKPWSIGDFARNYQWKIYAYALKTYETVYLINAPRDEKLWSPHTIKIFNKTITEQDKADALGFISRGIKIIENIQEELEKEMSLKKEKNYTGRSRYCFYATCSWCMTPGGANG